MIRPISIAPRDLSLIAAVCALQLGLVVLPIPVFGQSSSALIVIGVVSPYLVKGSVPRATLLLNFA